MKNKICEAIRNRNLIDFYYNGYHRVVEPFTFGINTKDNEVLSAFQVEGGSESGDRPMWRLFDLEKIENLQISSESFSGNRIGYRSRDSRMVRIYCEI